MKSPRTKPIRACKVLRKVLLAAFLPVLILATDARADRSLRCGTRIVSIGETSAQVRETCGEPDHLKQWEEGEGNHISQLFDYEAERYLAPKLIKGPIHMERWTYNLGSNKFIRYLYFQNGELFKIETGDKGSD